MNKTYSDLVAKFNNLSDEDKQVLLVYKSHLSLFINKLDRLEDEEILFKLQDEYEKYKVIITKPENMVIAKSIFSAVDFSTFEEFIKSLRGVNDKLNNLKSYFETSEELRLFRGVTIQKKEDIYEISDGNFISTTLDKDVIYDFYQGDGVDILYDITIPQGTSCLVIPYSIKVNNGSLKIIPSDSQQEIVLCKDDLDFEFINKTYDEEEDIIVVKVNAWSKNKIKD